MSIFQSDIYFGNEFGEYLSSLGGDNSNELTAVQKSMRSAIKEELTDRQWRAISLYYIQGLKMKEIAELMDISISTVSRHISRGMTRLKKRLRYSSKFLLTHGDEY